MEDVDRILDEYGIPRPTPELYTATWTPEDERELRADSAEKLAEIRRQVREEQTAEAEGVSALLGKRLQRRVA